MLRAWESSQLVGVVWCGRRCRGIRGGGLLRGARASTGGASCGGAVGSVCRGRCAAWGSGRRGSAVRAVRGQAARNGHEGTGEDAFLVDWTHELL